jgi:colanic acid/amylovoran biosynthesis glycosyltransferase
MATLVYIVHTIPESGGFCKTEFDYLTKKFEKIYIFSSVLGYEQIKELPNNCELHTFNPRLSSGDKLASIVHLLHTEFWNEFFWLVFKKKVSISFSLFFSLLQSLHLARKLKRIIVFECIEIRNGERVVVYSFWMNYMSIAVAMIKNVFPQIVSVTRAHGSDLYFAAQSLKFLPFRRFVASKMDKIYFISRKGREYFENLLSIYSYNWQVAYLGSLSVSQVTDFFESEQQIIISCSLVTSVKRLDLLVDALCLSSKRIKWIHIGDGQGLDLLKAHASKLPSNIEAHFEGYVNQNEVVNYFNRTKPELLINVSESEGIPVSMMEAMSVGVPVIATNVGGVDEIVENNYNGILMNANPTPFEISITIQEFLDLPLENRKQFRANAHSRWMELFNGDVNYSRFSDKLLHLSQY